MDISIIIGIISIIIGIIGIIVTIIMPIGIRKIIVGIKQFIIKRWKISKDYIHQKTLVNRKELTQKIESHNQNLTQQIQTEQKKLELINQNLTQQIKQLQADSAYYNSEINTFIIQLKCIENSIKKIPNSSKEVISNKTEFPPENSPPGKFEILPKFGLRGTTPDHGVVECRIGQSIYDVHESLGDRSYSDIKAQFLKIPHSILAPTRGINLEISSNGTIIKISTWDPRFKTREGIGHWCTKQEMIDNYGDPEAWDSGMDVWDSTESDLAFYPGLIFFFSKEEPELIKRIVVQT